MDLTRQSTLARLKRLRAEARKSGQPHPDICPFLTLCGVQFAIPRRGAGIRPRFKPDGSVVFDQTEDAWPEAGKLLELAPLAEENICPECGQPRETSLLLDVQKRVGFLKAAFELAGRLLDVQYNLTPDQKSELLGFDPQFPPEWPAQLLAWTQGMSDG